MPINEVLKVQKGSAEGVQEGVVICKRCGGSEGDGFHRVESFERIALADDPADPNCGHYYVEVVHVMRCAACEHRQEAVATRWPFQTLREAETERDSHIIGKG